jgi:glucose-6-phosphate isomerase
MFKVDLTNAKIGGEEISALSSRIKKINETLHKVDGTIENAWVELPNTMQKETAKIKDHAKWVREHSDVLFVIGIGGSYAGAYAGARMLEDFCDFPIEFLGTSLDYSRLGRMIKRYRDKRVSVNVISKSGTTIEILEAFKVVNEFMISKYPDTNEYKKRMIITTDEHNGLLRDYANKHGNVTFPMPVGVGGRYSVLSAVGVFPLCVAGLNIDDIFKGAKRAYCDCRDTDCEAYKYASARYLIHTKMGKDVETLATFLDLCVGFSCWWQQLFGESEGKDEKGILPLPLIFSRDLHSMGQFIQQGKRVLFETFLYFTRPPVAQPTFEKLNRAVYSGTVKAHAGAGIPLIAINAEKLDCEGFGYMVYFFEIACACSAYLLNVNPFNQPGVEVYKKEMREYI